MVHGQLEIRDAIFVLLHPKRLGLGAGFGARVGHALRDELRERHGFGQRGRRSVDLFGIERGEFLLEEPVGGAVAEQVMEVEQQEMFLRPELEEGGAEKRAAQFGEQFVFEFRHLFPGGGLALIRRQAGEVMELDVRRKLRMDRLRFAVGVDRRAQRAVTRDHLRQRFAQRLFIEFAGEGERGRFMVGAVGVGIDVAQQPESLFGLGQRHGFFLFRPDGSGLLQRCDFLQALERKR